MIAWVVELYTCVQWELCKINPREVLGDVTAECLYVDAFEFLNDVSYWPALAIFEAIFEENYITVREEATLVRVPNEVIPCRCNHKNQHVFKPVCVKAYVFDQTNTVQYILEISGVLSCLGPLSGHWNHQQRGSSQLNLCYFPCSWGSCQQRREQICLGVCRLQISLWFIW